MSQPLRFKPVNPAHEMVFSPEGGWVSWGDYQELQAEVERLTDDLEYREDLALRVKRITDQFTTPEVLLLRAQVERLTKAGDELHAFLINYIVESRISSAYLNKLDDDWNAAKEGKQP